MKKNSDFFDEEEKELVNSINNKEWKSVFNKKSKEKYQEYANYSMNKNKRINIRITERDLKKIQVKAIEEGLPYQSLISMIIHKYNSGRVKLL